MLQFIESSYGVTFVFLFFIGLINVIKTRACSKGLRKAIPARIHLFKVKDGNMRILCNVYSKLSIKTLQQSQ